MQNWTSKHYRREDKIYRGAFNYYRNENIYAEESFEVFRDKKDQTYHYISEAVVKVTTGEVLNLHVEYSVNKEYIPLYVAIEKLMGKEVSKEVFEYNTKRNFIAYTFTNSKDEIHNAEIVTAPKFHVATPTAASSLLFMRSKKFDASGKNSFNTLVSFNQWDYKQPPSFKNLLLERASLTAEKISIDGQSVQATQFRMYDESTDFKNIKEPPHVKVFLSQHGGIPYLVRTDDGTKIQIKYLNDLNEKE